MDNNQKNKDLLREYIKNNKKFITQYRMKEILDKEIRALSNIRMFSGIHIPDSINSISDLLYFIDDSDGVCEKEGCNNKKSRDQGRWELRKFCDRKCADLDFSVKQRGSNNSFHNITEESRKNMGSKISKNVRERIATGEFTPNITNSWSNSKISVMVNGEIKFVRSSWEAYFYILNPDLFYEVIRIPYFDEIKGKVRNYITDFCDFNSKIIYEIKPKNKIEDNNRKIIEAKKWCEINSYRYEIITQDWLIGRYDRSLVYGQPEGDRIIYLIEKMIKYEN